MKESNINASYLVIMKPLLQRLPLSEQTSFVARTYTTPLFETTWHRHPEIELILQLKGKGMCIIGNHIGGFIQGDIFLLGSNLPHEFRKEDKEMECSVMVIHFDRDFFGAPFWQMPESHEIKQLLDQSRAGFKLTPGYAPALAESIRQLEHAYSFERIVLLCQCLSIISKENNKQMLSTFPVNALESFSDEKINRVFEFIISHFQNPILLVEVAAIANMSVSAFCRYFKRSTKKTYVEFLNEIRIGHACHSLLNTDKTILQIAYDSGFNTIANFNKSFLKLKGLKPSVYRKKISG